MKSQASFVLTSFFLILLSVSTLSAQPTIPGFACVGTFNGKDYYVSNTGTDWYAARDTCRRLGGNLACIGSAAENNFIATSTSTMGCLWLGFNDDSLEGTWVWVNNEPVNYTNWYPGEPNNFGGSEDFAIFNYGAIGSWADASASYGARILLERNSILPVELTMFRADPDFGHTDIFWRTESEVNNAYFQLYRSLSVSDSGQLITRVPGRGNSSVPSVYNLIDTQVLGGITYFYRLYCTSSDSIIRFLADTLVTPWWIPAGILSFQATGQVESIHLTWQTEFETNNSFFKLYRSTNPMDSLWQYLTRINSMAPSGNSVATLSYQYSDSLLQPNVTYFYRLSAVTRNSNEYTFPGVTNATALANEVSGTNAIPHFFRIVSLFPNPFNSSTTISYTIPKSGEVSLKLYDLNGREVSTLVNFTQNPGTYTVKIDGSNLASGTYFVRLQSGEFTQTRKIVLLR